MNFDLKKLVLISDFRPEDKKTILDNFDTLTPEAKLKLWDLCLENLQWKFEIEFSRRFHEGVFNGVINKKDTTDYQRLEEDVLLEIFTKADLKVRQEEITAVQNLLKSFKEKNSTPLST